MPSKAKEKIIAAALIALAKNPRISLDGIADAAGVGRATLYRHFRSRDDLMKALVLEADRAITDTIRPILEKELSSMETLRELVAAIIPMANHFQFLLTEPFTLSDVDLKDSYQHQLKLLEGLAISLKEDEQISQDFSNAWISLTLSTLLYNAWIGIYEGDLAPKAAPELVIRTFLNGFGKNR